jgi:hypothetical protein
MIARPLIFEASKKNEHMSELVFMLMECAEKNVDLGYRIDLQHLEEIVGGGLTYETFDMLIANLNTELRRQYDSVLVNTKSNPVSQPH